MISYIYKYIDADVKYKKKQYTRIPNLNYGAH